MKYFVFRNQTVEPFLGYNDIQYSGYDDVSFVPDQTDRFIWFYQVPFKINSKQLSDEISTYVDKLKLVVSRIGNKEMWIFTLVNLFPCRLISSDMQVEEAICRFNQMILTLAQAHHNLRVINFNEFTNRYSDEQLISWKFYLISQMQLNPKLAKDFAVWFEHKERELTLVRKKCLVLDLDNTLWGGILGEDGAAGIQIGGDYPGKAYTYWQQALLELSKVGVILTVCSKNNEQDVLDVWKNNPFMVLRKEHFCAWRINWKDKALNIEDLAKELNIGLDSMVYVDDSQTERELIKQMLPMVAVPDFPQKPYELMSFFRKLVNDYFCIYNITEEDSQRTTQYKTNAQREIERHRFVDFNTFLESLRIEITVSLIDEYNISRVAQMTQKTNQFNMTTHRLTEQDIRQQLLEGWKIFCLRVKDRFGDDGITGAIFITPTHHIDNLLLSCRILGKGIEYAFVSYVLNLFRREGIEKVTASFLPSSKNMQATEFYDVLGFTLESTLDNEKFYSMTLTKELPIKKFYKIKMD